MTGQGRAKRLGFLGQIGEARQRALAALDNSLLAKTVGGEAALQTGKVLGLGRGAVNTAKGVVQGGYFLSRLVNPFDPLISRPGEAAVSQVRDAAVGVGRYITQGIADPNKVANDLRGKVHGMRIAIDPFATPTAKTFTGELKRNLAIGKNQGELAFDVGSLAFGGAAVKGLKGVAAVPEAVAIAKFTKQGHSSIAAKDLAQPYIHPGHHTIHNKLPKKIFGLKVPESIRSKYKPPVALRNSGIFILKPNNINKGDMYELHYKVDGDFHGTSIKRGAAPEVWSGKALGFHKHNLPGMLWYGTTPALKGILSSVELGGLGYQKWEEGR